LGPIRSDARSASPRENAPSRHFRAFLRKAILVGMAHTAEGRAPHARMDDSRFTEAWPRSATGPSFAPNDYVMPRLQSGLAMRARRPRPSERITFRVISGPSPLGHLTLDSPSPRRGGLRTPAMTPLASPGHGPARRSPLGPAPLEGRAPHARKGRHCAKPKTAPFLATGLSPTGP